MIFVADQLRMDECLAIPEISIMASIPIEFHHFIIVAKRANLKTNGVEKKPEIVYVVNMTDRNFLLMVLKKYFRLSVVLIHHVRSTPIFVKV
jgi:hypothetical protein